MVLGEIGRGGMATVYRARQESLDRIVAIKELNLSRTTSDAKARERFQMEAGLRPRWTIPTSSPSTTSGKEATRHI